MDYQNFNSRLRKETNQDHPADLTSGVVFNSRLRKETNRNKIVMAAYQIISIHVSVRRRTQRNQTSFSTKLISTHVSARERTPSFKYSLNALSVLQLTSPQGDEHKIPLPPQVDRNFNSRLRKETNRNTAPVSRA